MPAAGRVAWPVTNDAADSSGTCDVGAANRGAAGRPTRWESAGYDAVKVTVFGSTAIATGIFKGKGMDGKGKHLDESVRWTDTWVKMPGRLWQCVASHVSPIKM